MEQAKDWKGQEPEREEVGCDDENRETEVWNTTNTESNEMVTVSIDTSERHSNKLTTTPLE